ncbi:glycosyltransferase family 1 protein [Bacteroides sp.]|uniref:glycosyltransferase family 1 protein n=1 Tax=Bacteroides sp. TaxID=29523 RepID=UPI002635B844|nr:glycosyltransferase family 1 protein [Bacteroides sp.]MDD3037758.1 glycosyltransferase family 1 protein [Bacteroides sp.]
MNGCNTNAKGIKALIVFRETGDTDNLFATVLCDAIRLVGIEVQCSVEEFWNSDMEYNIIHFQWPEEVIGRNSNDFGIISRLKERIDFFRSRGTHFIYTRHNLCPSSANEVINHAYEIIESESDIVVHMGHYSLNEFAAGHSGSRNVIIPHPVYEYTYREDISIERARQYLNLPQDAFIVTAFGKFHNNKERRMTLNAFSKWNKRNKLLLAPRFYPFSRINKYGHNFLKRWISRTGYYLLIPLFNHFSKIHAGASDEMIDSCDLPYYIAACDMVFIQRKEALNSAMVPLAFLYHKVVVGPNVGNIGEWLRETSNPTFNPDDPPNIVKALEKGNLQTIWYKGEGNYSYAMKHMNIKKVGKEYAQIYMNLTNN